jgi:hypothetical protein
MTVAENWLEYEVDIKPGQLTGAVQAVSPILWPPGHG